MLVALIIFVALGLEPNTVSAQELFNEHQGLYRGRVVEILDQENREIPGTDAEHLVQTIRAEILTGPQAGRIVTMENDYLELKTNDRFYLNLNVYMDGSEIYTVNNIDRLDALVWLAVMFILAVIVFGGWQGARSLLALGGSFLVIFYVLIPGLLQDWDPLLTSLAVASGILFAAIFFTHGFNRESAVAYTGTMIAVLLSGLLALLAVRGSRLSGLASDESVYLNLNTGGTLDFTGLLLGAIIIGVLGILDDIAVTQAAVVAELFDSNKEMTRREAYRRALRVGREHVGALVNTLVLAYTGASLPILLYFYQSSASPGATLNSELFATEIVRSIIGSIGLILTVPIVTLLAVIYLRGHKTKTRHSHP